MHGVSKTALTDEQKEAKRLERQKKQERFLKVRDVIFKKSEAGHFDEEGLKLTAAVLTKNPDLYVFWNYRKRTILSLIESSTSCATTQTTPDDHLAEPKKSTDYVDLYRSELALTEECLRDNPKSYAAWYHRQWILHKYFRGSSQAAELLKSELRHCAEALKYDERNFHCWDHRRFVCRLASVSEVMELEFSKDKIDENFSNYSAWHYRSALLPHLFPPAEKDSVLRLEETKLNEELLYVQNAFFTDPEDQSAWFYHCWLFRPMEKETEKLALRYFHLSPSTPAAVILAFNRAVNLNGRSSPVKVLVDGLAVLTSGWSTPDGSRSCQVCINVLSKADAETLLAGKNTIKICINGETAMDIELKTAKRDEKSDLECYSRENVTDRVVTALQPSLPSAFREALENSMNSCRELKSLVEPTSNKWPSLTEILSMRSLDLLQYESVIQSGLDTLKVVDPSKRAYYDDLKSKFVVEARLLKSAVDGAGIRNVQLAGLGITALPSLGTIILMIGVRDLNLDDNRLVSVAALGHLLSLRRLSLKGNLLRDTKGLGSLIHLEYLSLASNRLGPPCSDSLVSLKDCGSLRHLILTGNPICAGESSDTIVAFLGRPKDTVSVLL